MWHTGLNSLIQDQFPDCYIHLLHSYLHQRELQVTYERTTSGKRSIRVGVPQSALSPLLYTLYTADIPTAQPCRLATFADDTAIFATNKTSPTLKSQSDDSYNNWSAGQVRRIRINADKSQTVIFTKRRTIPPQLTLFNQDIPYTTQAKYLGVILDSKLTFEPHITYLANRAKEQEDSTAPTKPSAELHHQNPHLQSHDKITDVIRRIHLAPCSNMPQETTANRPESRTPPADRPR